MNTRSKPKKTKRQTVYIPPGIYGVGMMEILFPPDKFRVVVTDDKKKWNA